MKTSEKIVDRLEDGKVVKVKVYMTETSYLTDDGFYSANVYKEEEGFTDEQIKANPDLVRVPRKVTKEKLTLKDKGGNVLWEKEIKGIENVFCLIMRTP